MAETDSEGQARIAAFRQGLEALGWSEGKNIHIDYRWGANAELRRNYAAELVALSPDVLFAAANPAMLALHEVTNTIPIVAAQIADPIGAGVVRSIAHPGGNLTGFLNLEDTIGQKWLELLKEIAPDTAQVGVIYDPNNPSWKGMFREVERKASTVGTTLSTFGVHSDDEIDYAFKTIAGTRLGGMIIMPAPVTTIHRKSITALAAQYRVPTVYGFRYFVSLGGLISYGSDNHDLYRRAASYIDRVLHGEKPADLPVQAPTKFDLSINLKTAKALGLNIPSNIQVSADQVIE